MASASRAAPRLDIISIGTLSRNRLWGEADARRTAHATTTLIRAGDRSILIDPALPPPALAARLYERTGLTPDRIDTVFLTNFRAAHRHGLALFPKAKLLLHERELEFARADLDAMLEQAPEEDDDAKLMRRELALLDTVQSPDDTLLDGVDLFPLFGYTPGTCGLLVASPTTTTLVAGDTVPTYDHFLAGQVLPDSKDVAAAQAAMAEVYEIADLVVPGHDNLFLNPRMQGM